MKSRAVFHQLLDLYEPHWQVPGYKPYLSPSRVATYEFCPRKYRWKYVKRLVAPGSGFKLEMLQGSYYHVMAWAHDQGSDVKAALGVETARLITDPGYHVKWSDTLAYLQLEMHDKWLPTYVKFLEAFQIEKQFETLMLEEEVRYETDSYVLITIPDKVVRDRYDGTIWVVERKTTGRDDSNWYNKWQQNAQTTAEVLAVEKHLDEPVEGVYIEPVVVTRKRSQAWTQSYPQPIHNFTHYGWRPVDKNLHIKQEWKRYMEGIVQEMKWRDTNDLAWHPRLANCDRCELHPYCRGQVDYEDPLLGLVPIEDGPIEDAVKASRLAAGTPPQAISPPRDEKEKD